MIINLLYGGFSSIEGKRIEEAQNGKSVLEFRGDELSESACVHITGETEYFAPIINGKAEIPVRFANNAYKYAIADYKRKKFYKLGVFSLHTICGKPYVECETGDLECELSDVKKMISQAQKEIADLKDYIADFKKDYEKNFNGYDI